MDAINIFGAVLEGRLDVARAVGSTATAMFVYQLAAGESSSPYHYEYEEEWLIVLGGRVTVRHPEGEDVLGPGDVVCFGVGPGGAHRLTNATDETARVLMVSTMVEPSVAVYPDSDKIGVWPGDDRDHVIVRRGSAVDYYDGEA